MTTTKNRTIIGFAILFVLAGTFGLCYVAFNTSPKQNDIWWGIRFHEPDTIWKIAPTQPKTHKDSLADSCRKAIIKNYNDRHGIKTLEDK